MRCFELSDTRVVQRDESWQAQTGARLRYG